MKFNIPDLQILDFVRTSETYASIVNAGCNDTQILDVSLTFDIYPDYTRLAFSNPGIFIFAKIS